MENRRMGWRSPKQQLTSALLVLSHHLTAVRGPPPGTPATTVQGKQETQCHRERQDCMLKLCFENLIRSHSLFADLSLSLSLTFALLLALSSARSLRLIITPSRSHSLLHAAAPRSLPSVPPCPSSP